MTYQNIGYWIGQANDTSTGAHPAGWTNGQRWLETAGEWQTMYGTSQTDLSNMTGSRDYWQHTVAHNDPNVWDNRYNAGYSAADIAESPRDLSHCTASQLTGYSNSFGNWTILNLNNQSQTGLTFFTNSNTIVAPRTGYYAIGFWINMGSAGSQYGYRVNGVAATLGHTDAVGTNPGTSNNRHGYSCLSYVTQGTVIQFAGYADNAGGANGNGDIWIAFVPTPANPQ